MGKKASPEARMLKMLSNLRNDIVRYHGEEALAPIYDGTTVAGLMSGKVRTWFPTDLRNMDSVLGKEGMGIPCGKLIEIFGSEGQGKSSLAYYLLGRVQAMGGIAILIDTERSYDPDWAALLGVDNTKLIVLVPAEDSCLETYFDMIHAITDKARRIDPEVLMLFVLDTIYCTPTAEQLRSKSYLDTQRMAALSRGLSSHLPSLCNFISKRDVGLIFLNQVRDNIGVMYGEKFKTPGGHALLHMATVRAQVKRTLKLKGGAIQSVVVNHKNKVAPPFSKSNIVISPAAGMQEAAGKGEEDV